MSGNLRSALRGVAFLVVLAWMIGNPAYRQLARGQNPHFRAWVMFSGIGTGGIDARFYVRHEDGSLEGVDRWLHTDREPPSRGTRRRIKDRRTLDLEILRLCRALGPGTDLRVSARQGKRSGWVWIVEQESNACKDAARRQSKRKRKRNRRRT